MSALPPHPPEHETLQLLERIRHNDDDAWTELYELYHDELLFMIRQQLGPRLRTVLQSEDIFQSVALEAFRDLPRFEDRGEGSLRAFLHKLVLNKIRDRADYFSARKRAPGATPDTTRLDEIAQHDEPLRYHDAERFEKLERALQALGPEMREIVLLRRIEGLPSKDVAARIGRSDDAVRKLYSRALARLSLLMGGDV